MRVTCGSENVAVMCEDEVWDVRVGGVEVSELWQ